MIKPLQMYTSKHTTAVEYLQRYFKSLINIHWRVKEGGDLSLGWFSSSLVWIGVLYESNIPRSDKLNMKKLKLKERISLLDFSKIAVKNSISRFSRAISEDKSIATINAVTANSSRK